MPRKSASKRSKKKSRAGAGSKPQGPMRLQRLLASAGFGSRRQCEELIQAGRVSIDGDVVTQLGTTVEPDLHKVRVDGDLLKKRKLVYYAINKPIGVVTTNRDPQGRPRVVDLVPPDERVFPVGRLDRNSEGLILLTNDGELAQRLTHPKFGVRKVYRVTVAGKVDSETMKQMRRGIYIAEGLVRVDGAKVVKSRSRSTELEIVLREGKNREIRRILARLGHKVQHLRRIAVGPLRLGDLPAGAYRVLRHQEVEKLWRATEADEQGHGKRSPRKGPARPSGGKARSGKPKRPRGAAAGGPKKASRKRGRQSRAEREATELPLEPSRTVGAVIGGDTSADVETPRRKSSKTAKSQTSKSGRSTSRGGKAIGRKKTARGGKRSADKQTGGRGKQGTRGSKKSTRGSKKSTRGRATKRGSAKASRGPGQAKQRSGSKGKRRS